MDETKVSIVIVSWNSWEFLPACLDSILAQKGPSLEIIVVDNNSRDGTPQKLARLYPEVKMIFNPRNLGYAKACNQGMKESTSEFILLLNPDTVLHPQFLHKTLDFLRANPQMGAVGPQLLDVYGKVQPSCRRFPSYVTLLWELTGLSRVLPRSRIFGAWRMGDFDFQSTREVDQPMASALLVTRKAIEKSGLMDERFKMFFNDVDLCFRIKAQGFKIFHLPEAKVTHHLGGSTSKRKGAMLFYSHLGLFRYLQKHHSKGFKFPVLLVSGISLFIGALVRWTFLPFKILFGKRRN
jgi:GT2 family glycosyltransferase